MYSWLVKKEISHIGCIIENISEDILILKHDSYSDHDISSYHVFPTFFFLKEQYVRDVFNVIIKWPIYKRHEGIVLFSNSITVPK